jgi:hypothetical protein
MVRKRMCLAGVVLLAGAVSAVAQTRQLPGYHCMMLNLTERAAADPNISVQILGAPSAQATPIGTASAVVIVQNAGPVNGYLHMLMPNGNQGWIAQHAVKPYRAEANPSARCVPEILSNGRIGFGRG